MLIASIHGAAAMRLCERLAPGEDADALATVTLDAALTGLRAGVRSLILSLVHCLYRSEDRFSHVRVPLSVHQSPLARSCRRRPRCCGLNAQASAAASSTPRPWPLTSRRRSRAARSIASFALRDRCSRTSRPKSAPNPADASSRPRSNAAAASTPARSWSRISAAEAAAQLQEAEANAAQIEARLGLTAGVNFDPMRVPDVHERQGIAGSGRSRVHADQSLLDQKVVSQSEFDQRRTQVEAARQQYQVALNSAAAVVPLASGRARARDPRAQSRSRHLVSAPFTGIVAERLVSVGDYVTRGNEGRDGGADRSASRRADRFRSSRCRWSASGSRSS